MFLLTIRKLCFKLYGVFTCVLVVRICAYVALHTNRRNQKHQIYSEDYSYMYRVQLDCNYTTERAEISNKWVRTFLLSTSTCLLENKSHTGQYNDWFSAVHEILHEQILEKWEYSIWSTCKTEITLNIYRPKSNSFLRVLKKLIN